LWPIYADKDQLSQVIQNLVPNADQAMETGGIITISAENNYLEKENKYKLDSGEYVEINIKDNGPGIPGEIIDSIFDPYFSTKADGSGLGLSICHTILQKHQGIITVESIIGQGSAFTVVIAASEDKNTIMEVENSQKLRRKFSGSILIMDDKDYIRITLSNSLEHIGFQVESFENGTSLINYYKKSLNSDDAPKLIILDLTIPGEKSGDLVAKEIHDINPSQKIVLSSGYNENLFKNTNHEQLNSLFCGRLNKPYMIEEIIELISSLGI